MSLFKINKFPKRSFVLLLSSIFVLNFLILTSYSYKVSAKETLVTQNIDATETMEQVINPDRGFYTLLPTFTTNPSSSATKSVMGKYVSSIKEYCDTAKSVNESMLFLKIHLTKGSDGNYISNSSKELLNKAFEEILNNDMKVVVRATYSVTSDANLEPTDINTIYSNIKDLCEVFNKNTDAITVVETGLLGPWGEMHTSSYLPITGSNSLDATSLTNIVNTYLDNLDSSLQLSVRRPSYYRAIFEKDDPIKKKNAYSGTDESRVGLYNDGYLGSESDLGTYTDWTRSEELAFQDNHNRYTIFGGEAVLESKNPNKGYALDSDAAITDMSKIHVTYLNDEWDKTLLDLWASDTCSFDQKGYDYIANHLGYRFVLKKSELSTSLTAGGTMEGKIEIKNTGFANLVKDNKVQVVFKSGEKSYTVDTNINPRFWESKATTTENFSISVPSELTEGTWNVYLKIPDRTGDDNCAIKFANTTGFDKTVFANNIGIVDVTTSSAVASSDNTNLSEDNDNSNFKDNSIGKIAIYAFLIIIVVSIFSIVYLKKRKQGLENIIAKPSSDLKTGRQGANNIAKSSRDLKKNRKSPDSSIAKLSRDLNKSRKTSDNVIAKSSNDLRKSRKASDIIIDTATCALYQNFDGTIHKGSSQTTKNGFWSTNYSNKLKADQVTFKKNSKFGYINNNCLVVNACDDRNSFVIHVGFQDANEDDVISFMTYIPSGATIDKINSITVNGIKIMGKKELNSGRWNKITTREINASSGYITIEYSSTTVSSSQKLYIDEFCVGGGSSPAGDLKKRRQESNNNINKPSSEVKKVRKTSDINIDTAACALYQNFNGTIHKGSSKTTKNGYLSTNYSSKLKAEQVSFKKSSKIGYKNNTSLVVNACDARNAFLMHVGFQDANVNDIISFMTYIPRGATTEKVNSIAVNGIKIMGEKELVAGKWNKITTGAINASSGYITIEYFSSTATLSQKLYMDEFCVGGGSSSAK